MKTFLGKAVSAIRETVSGRRRLAKFDHPGAHRQGSYNPDSAIVNHHVPTQRPPFHG